MKRAHLFLLGIGFSLVVSAASAETAYTTKSVNLRAGPSRDYEVVVRAPAGVPVEVYGCVDDWTWCDVSLGGDDRGWVYAGNLEYPYENRRVVVLGHGPLVGFPIVTFSLDSYWDNYYRGRPWYSRRSYWDRRPPPAHWIGSPRPSVVRPGVIRPGIDRPSRPSEVVRPRENRPRPEVRTQSSRPEGRRPEVSRAQPQPARPAPVKPQENKSRGRQDNKDRRPGGN
jgi:uncharacterized protein YraI